MKKFRLIFVFLLVGILGGCAVYPSGSYPHRSGSSYSNYGWYSTPDAAIDHGETMRSRVLQSAPAGGVWTNRGFTNDYSLHYRNGQVNENFRLHGSGRGTIQ
jgi:hypothetical protein